MRRSSGHNGRPRCAANAFRRGKATRADRGHDEANPAGDFCERRNDFRKRDRAAPHPLGQVFDYRGGDGRILAGGCAHDDTRREAVAIAAGGPALG